MDNWDCMRACSSAALRAFSIASFMKLAAFEGAIDDAPPPAAPVCDYCVGKGNHQSEKEMSNCYLNKQPGNVKFNYWWRVDWSNGQLFFPLFYLFCGSLHHLFNLVRHRKYISSCTMFITETNKILSHTCSLVSMPGLSVGGPGMTSGSSTSSKWGTLFFFAVTPSPGPRASRIETVSVSSPKAS